MKVAIYTLGCKVNQYETQAMEQTLRARGHKVVDFSSDADAYVVNTCSVTAVSDQKSRQVIHRAKRQHPAAVMAGQIFIKQHNSEAGCIHKKQGNKHVRISFLWVEAGLI